MISASESKLKRDLVSHSDESHAVPFVSVIIPCRNEQDLIGKCLASFASSTYPADFFEVLVVDGMSEDRTRDVVGDFTRRCAFIKLLLNPKKITPAALNLGIAKASGNIVIRADAHNVYPPDYVRNCVDCIHSTGADNVGGPWITEPADHTLTARLVAAVLSSPFGVGNSQFRVSQKEGPVDTVPFGAFRRELFARTGIFNEKLLRNQDVDFNARIRAAGGTIYQTPVLTTHYFPPASFRQLLRKTIRETQWHVFTIAENPRALRARHLVPAVFVGSLIVLTALGVVSHASRLALAILAATYAAGAVFFSFRAAARYGWALLPTLPFGFFLYHLCYGVATCVGLCRMGQNSQSTIPFR